MQREDDPGRQCIATTREWEILRFDEGGGCKV